MSNYKSSPNELNDFVKKMINRKILSSHLITLDKRQHNKNGKKSQNHNQKSDLKIGATNGNKFVKKKLDDKKM